MRVIVQTDFDVEMLNYSTDPEAMCLHPGPENSRIVIAALAEAIVMLSPPLHDNGDPGFTIVDAIDATEPKPSHLKLVD